MFQELQHGTPISEKYVAFPDTPLPPLAKELRPETLIIEKQVAFLDTPKHSIRKKASNFLDFFGKGRTFSYNSNLPDNSHREKQPKSRKVPK